MPRNKMPLSSKFKYATTFTLGKLKKLINKNTRKEQAEEEM